MLLRVKTNERTFPTIYWPNGNPIKFSHMSQIRFSASDAMANSTLTNQHQNPARGCGPPSNTPMIGPTPLIVPNGSSIGSRTFAETPQSPHWLQWNAPNKPPKSFLIALGNLQYHLPASSSNLADPPSQTTSNQPFFHSSVTRQTDRPTDGSTTDL